MDRKQWNPFDCNLILNEIIYKNMPKGTKRSFKLTDPANKKLSKTTASRTSKKILKSSASPKLASPKLLMTNIQSELIHSPIIYKNNGSELSFYRIINPSKTVDIQYNQAIKTGMTLMLDKDNIEQIGDIGKVYSQDSLYSFHLDYRHIYILKQQGSDEYNFQGVGPQIGSQPPNWTIRFDHDDFASAFLGAVTESQTTPPTYHIRFSKNIGTIKTFQTNPNLTIANKAISKKK